MGLLLLSKTDGTVHRHGSPDRDHAVPLPLTFPRFPTMAKPRQLPSLEKLNELLRYDPGTGDLFWRVTVNSQHKEGSLAGGLNAGGYRRVGICGVYYLAHRICWSLYHKNLIMVDQMIDHINGDRSDNRIDNLRIVECWQNNHNRRDSKVDRGVFFLGEDKPKPWKAWISVRNNQKHLGHFKTKEEAIVARRNAELKHGIVELKSEAQTYPLDLHTTNPRTCTQSSSSNN